MTTPRFCHSQIAKLSFGVLFFLAGIRVAPAQEPLHLRVEAGAHDRTNTPVTVEIAVPSVLKDATYAELKNDHGSQTLLGQVTAPSLLATPAANGDKVPRELHFVLLDLKAGESADYTVTISSAPATKLEGTEFHWQDTPHDHDDLLFGNRPVLRYMYQPLDESSSDQRMATFKPYYHIFDPAGETLLTKGPGGLWPHHHGVFYGFREVTYDDGKKCDIWHCPAAFQEHTAFLYEEAGPMLARQLAAINWVAEPKLEKNAVGNEPNQLFAKEQREVTVYGLSSGNLIEFASRLNALLPPVHLDGDPQHSGFHFRAANQVHTDAEKQTYFLRPDGKGPECAKNGKGPEETRNWDSKTQDPRTVNLPWDAMSFVVDGKRYTVVYLDNQNNPKPSRGSEREYGRIGSYFVADLPDKEKTLDVHYRLWIQPGEMTVDQCVTLDADFNDPPKVTVK